MLLNWLRYQMGDGAREITKAGLEVFGNVGVRLMCWPHTYRNLLREMSALNYSAQTILGQVP